MNKTLRKAVIAGNWKMNKTRPEAKELLEAIKPLVANAEGKVEVIACVPYTNLETAVAATAGSNVKVSAQRLLLLQVLSLSFALANFFRKEKQTSQRKLSHVRSSLTSQAFPLMISRRLSLLTSLFGLSAQARLLLQIRLRRFAHSSVQLLQSFTVLLLLTLLRSSTAVL